MNINRFIENNGIKRADAIIVKRERLALFDHYVIFLGYDNTTYEPVFIANFENGVDILTTYKLLGYLKKYKPVSIRRFKGTEYERSYAIKRAFDDLRTKNRRTYNLIKNNCEHFAGWVQKGIRESEQVKEYGDTTAITGAGIAITGLLTKDRNMTIGGILLSLLGVYISSFRENNT